MSRLFLITTAGGIKNRHIQQSIRPTLSLCFNKLEWIVSQHHDKVRYFTTTSKNNDKMDNNNKKETKASHPSSKYVNNNNNNDDTIDNDDMQHGSLDFTSTEWIPPTKTKITLEQQRVSGNPNFSDLYQKYKNSETMPNHDDDEEEKETANFEMELQLEQDAEEEKLRRLEQELEKYNQQEQQRQTSKDTPHQEDSSDLDMDDDDDDDDNDDEMEDEGYMDWLRTRRKKLQQSSTLSTKLEVTRRRHLLYTKEELISVMEEVGCTDIQVYLDDIKQPRWGGITGMIIATAQNPYHISSVSSVIIDCLRERDLQSVGVIAAMYGSEGGDPRTETWRVVDCSNWVVHLLDNTTRNALNLEGLWTGTSDPMYKIDLNNEDEIEEYIANYPISNMYRPDGMNDDDDELNNLLQLQKSTKNRLYNNQSVNNTNPLSVKGQKQEQERRRRRRRRKTR